MNLYYCNVRFIGDGIIELEANSLEEAAEKLTNGDYHVYDYDIYDFEPQYATIQEIKGEE